MAGFPFASLRDEEQTSIAMKYEQWLSEAAQKHEFSLHHQGGQASHSVEDETGRRASKDILTAWHSPHYYGGNATGKNQSNYRVCVELVCGCLELQHFKLVVAQVHAVGNVHQCMLSATHLLSRSFLKLAAL